MAQSVALAAQFERRLLPLGLPSVAAGVRAGLEGKKPSEETAWREGASGEALAARETTERKLADSRPKTRPFAGVDRAAILAGFAAKGD